MRFSSTLLCLLVAGFAIGEEPSRPNILFLAVDDLRPELACYGKKHIHSPNIDKLAKRSVLFERAYCMVPTCGASRASLMTGIRPKRNRFVNHLTWAEKDAPGIVTLNTHLKANGYSTHSLGKIFHHKTDSKDGWSQPAWRPSAPSYHIRANLRLHRQRMQNKDKKQRGPAFEAAVAPDSAYPDGMIADKAIERLGQLAENDKPFFLAVGFLKPHLPFVCPKKYWDLYDPDKIHLPKTYHPPKNAPARSIHKSGELRAYADIPAKGPVSDEMARKLIHGYYACVSFTDAQIGRVLVKLDQLGLSKNTIVVLWGDHGWNLGEHTLWCKHSCYETSMQIPLLIHAPGISAGRTKSLTETIDLYPTLCELTGVTPPKHLQGMSLTKVLRDPSLSLKTQAVGRFGPGDTIRTDSHRYTEYTGPRGQLNAKMLYDHRTDPVEDVNVAGQSKSAVEELSKRLKNVKKATK